MWYLKQSYPIMRIHEKGGYPVAEPQVHQLKNGVLVLY